MCHVSHVTYHVPCVMCHMSHVTCPLSLPLRVRDKHPPNVNSSIIDSKLVCKEPKTPKNHQNRHSGNFLEVCQYQKCASVSPLIYLPTRNRQVHSARLITQLLVIQHPVEVIQGLGVTNCTYEHFYVRFYVLSNSYEPSYVLQILYVRSYVHLYVLPNSYVRLYVLPHLYGRLYVQLYMLLIIYIYMPTFYK